MITDWLAEQKLSPRTKETYTLTVTKALADLGDMADLTPAAAIAWLESRHWSAVTQWTNWCAIKSYLKWRYGASHPALRLKLKRGHSPPGRRLHLDQTGRLLASFNTASKTGLRDLAICSLALDSGLRCAELCDADTTRLDVPGRTLIVPIKGGGWGQARFGEHTQLYMLDWLAARGTPKTPALFVNSFTHQRLTRDGLRTTVRRWGKRIGIILSPHDLRRTFACLASEAGAPSRLVQLAGRWEHIDMVELYTRNVETNKFRWFPVDASESY